MAPMTCGRCGSKVAPTVVVCLTCGFPVARSRSAGAVTRKLESAEVSDRIACKHDGNKPDAVVCIECGAVLQPRTEDSSSEGPEPTTPTGVSCQHLDSRPGSVTCVTCGEPIGLRQVNPPPCPSSRGHVVLSLPWGEHTLEPGDVLDIGRDVGPFERPLEPYPTVGRRHATLRLTDTGTLLLRDNASTNGTFVDGVRCSPTGEIEVRDGAEVRFSSALLMRVRREA